MKHLREQRERSGASQRSLAARAGLSYKTLQLIEAGRHDPKLSTIEQIATALGYPRRSVEQALASIFELPPDSTAMISLHIREDGDDSWKTWLFEFTDAFRAHHDPRLIAAPPIAGISERITALIASTVEALCDELLLPIPRWCNAIPALPDPWFVSGMETLKASALVESPVHFRKRNIFVLENFLSRR